MATLFGMYKTDAKAEADGKWVEIAPGAEFCIRSSNAIVVREYSDKLAKGQRSILMANKGVLPPALQDKNEIAVVANAILTGWRGPLIVDAAGNPMPFTKANAEWLMTELPGLRRDILFASRVDETFRLEDAEKIEGNSVAPSAPTSN